MPLNEVILPHFDAQVEPARGRDELESQIFDWLTSDALLRLMKLWDADIPVASTKLDLVLWEANFVAQNWDFRNNRERNQVEAVALSKRIEELVRDCARALGLVEARPPQRTEYDHLLVLGGLVRACVTRSREAAKLAASGIVFGELSGLSALRPINEQEVPIADALGLESKDEFALMVEAIRRAFQLDDPVNLDGSAEADATQVNEQWRVARLRETPRIEVLAAPSTDPANRRANTADTYRWWRRRLSRAGGSVLIVTNPIYIPYQGAAALNILGIESGMDVEMVGVSTESSDLGTATQKFSATNYLQEIGSAVKAYVGILNELRK